MKRIKLEPRNNWERLVIEHGFIYYKNYYNETAAYEFSLNEIEKIEQATAAIFEHCIEAMEHILKHRYLLKKFHIPEKFHQIIAKSWKDDHISFYGRFDLAYDGSNIKLLEFNADTPTSLLEASVIQLYWLQDFDSSLDQFNSIHEKLVAHIQKCQAFIADNKLTFASVANSDEDFVTVKYLEDCAAQAGMNTEFVYIDQISVNEKNAFCKPDGEEIKTIFKLYPYEWMFNEEFGDYLISNFDTTSWIEPFYKSVWSNKMFLAILSDLFPTSPFILKAGPDASAFTSFVKKPLLSREGANVSIIKNGQLLESSDGEYGREGYIFQEYFEIPTHEGRTPVIGSWLIGGEPGGIGIRESTNLITDNTSFFVPHYISR